MRPIRINGEAGFTEFDLDAVTGWNAHWVENDAGARFVQVIVSLTGGGTAQLLFAQMEAVDELVRSWRLKTQPQNGILVPNFGGARGN
jgi:hypothetical protein